MKQYECTTCNKTVTASDSVAAVLDLQANSDCKKKCNLVEVKEEKKAAGL